MIQDRLDIDRFGNQMHDLWSTSSKLYSDQPTDISMISSEGNDTVEDMNISLDEDELQELHDVVMQDVSENPHDKIHEGSCCKNKIQLQT